MQFSVEEVLHELAFGSESDDEPSSFDSSNFGWIMANYIVCIHTKFGRDLWRITKVIEY